MPPANYQAQADSIYNAQATTDAAQLADARNAQTAAFGTETADANSAYTDALGTAGKARDSAMASNDQVAQTHGLWTSGLAGNAQRLTYQNYVDNATKIGEQRAQKLTDIGTRASNATQAYATNYGALQSKYAGLKSQYISDHQNADAKAAAANQAKIEAAQIRASSKTPPDPAKGYGMSLLNTADSKSGLSFHGAHGEPISIGQYYGAQGGSLGDIVSALKSSNNPDDHDVADKIAGVKGGAAMNLSQAQQNFPWLFE